MPIRRLASLIKEQADGNALDIAQVYAFRDQSDEAMHWLERAYAQKDPYLFQIKGDRLMKGLEADPRYKAFLTQDESAGVAPGSRTPPRLILPEADVCHRQLGGQEQSCRSACHSTRAKSAALHPSVGEHAPEVHASDRGRTQTIRLRVAVDDPHLLAEGTAIVGCGFNGLVQLHIWIAGSQRRITRHRIRATYNWLHRAYFGASCRRRCDANHANRNGSPLTPSSHPHTPLHLASLRSRSGCRIAYQPTTAAKTPE